MLLCKCVWDHTWVLGVVLSLTEDLQWADGIHGVHLVVKSNEDLERLSVALRFLNNRTHLAGIVVGSGCGVVWLVSPW